MPACCRRSANPSSRNSIVETVEFIKPWKIYSPGDVAGFEASQAKILTDGKVAKPYEADAKAAKPAK
jgi:hypothetical protein